jgi:transcriptional regulator with XRE-family HTH domain
MSVKAAMTAHAETALTLFSMAKQAHEDSVGQRIARARKARGLTQAELAKRIDTIQAMVSDYESDRRRVYAQVLVKIAQELSVSVDELLGTVPQKGSTKGAMSLRFTRRLQKLDALPRAQQKFVLQTLDALLKSASS